MQGSQPSKRCITGEQKYTKEPSSQLLWDVKQSAGEPTRLSRGHFTNQGSGGTQLSVGNEDYMLIHMTGSRAHEGRGRTVDCWVRQSCLIDNSPHSGLCR